MGLAPSVLRKALPDIVFHSLVFIISMVRASPHLDFAPPHPLPLCPHLSAQVSFSTLFYIQLGPVVTGFKDQQASFISLARALFGDFDIDMIMDNSQVQPPRPRLPSPQTVPPLLPDHGSSSLTVSLA